MISNVMIVFVGKESGVMDGKKAKKHLGRRLLLALGILLATGTLVVGIAYAAVNVWPNLGARTVDLARAVFGDQIVAQVENLVLTSQDQLKQIKYHVTRAQPVAPWQSGNPGVSSLQNDPSQAGSIPASPQAHQAWVLASVPPLGTITGEGQWTPYLWDTAGNVVAYRTFLQPDPKRPYALVAVVAFNIDATRLHFVLGYDEPKSKITITRPARIPASDMQPGRILAAFNGGFKAQHGHFGVMLNDVTLIPPRDGFGTVGIYDDGKIVLGAWGKDVNASPHLIAYRQNGPLIVQDGTVNPRTAVTDPQDWGYTTYGDTATGRSSLGISSDGKVLYYAVGFNLTLPALARAVQRVGAYQAIQLDINNYYTHFEAIQFDGKNKPKAVPLLDQMKGPGDHRYLTIDSRDFFYVTLK
jgi:hypothetical protein